ncbi:hypothetical protein [Clostridium sp.]|jgi:hypothetical protein|uniref:hypothetical protein n=1 Tax=Clostridium sp. TaxID=1506 RepID=UPI00258EC991|nr:hypothetical protein [Clostridium sp.]MDF2503061.1 hypothetical protein [Clostridium sp.]
MNKQMKNYDSELKRINKEYNEIIEKQERLNNLDSDDPYVQHDKRVCENSLERLQEDNEDLCKLEFSQGGSLKELDYMYTLELLSSKNFKFLKVLRNFDDDDNWTVLKEAVKILNETN